MLGNGKMCLFASFMMGAAAGYMYHDYAVSARKHGKKGGFVPVTLSTKAKHFVEAFKRFNPVGLSARTIHGDNTSFERFGLFRQD